MAKMIAVVKMSLPKAPGLRPVASAALAPTKTHTNCGAECCQTYECMKFLPLF